MSADRPYGWARCTTKFLVLTVLAVTGTSHRAQAVSVPPIEVTNFSPQGQVKGVRQVVARFSAPVVNFGDPRTDAPFAARARAIAEPDGVQRARIHRRRLPGGGPVGRCAGGLPARALEATTVAVQCRVAAGRRTRPAPGFDAKAQLFTTGH